MERGKNGKRMVKELRIERERSKLNIEELTNLLDGGETNTTTRRRISKTSLLLQPFIINIVLQLTQY